jgi:CRP-like cAMP-binding protein
MNNSLESIINAHPFFAGMETEHLKTIAACASDATFEPQQFLFREGEPANQFYLIQSGRIALEVHELANGTVLVTNVGPGEVLGWSWLFPPFSWHFQARATERTKAIILNGAHLLVVAESDPAFGYELMKRVAQVVIERLQATRRQLLAREDRPRVAALLRAG